MTGSRISIAIAADLSLVRIAAAGLQGILRAFACDDEQGSLIVLAVVEAVNNAIEHAYAEDPHGRVELQLELAGDVLEISVIDSGHAMPAGALERARAGLGEAAGELREGGYGLGILVEAMSDVRYRTEANVNTLTMAITLRRRAA